MEKQPEGVIQQLFATVCAGAVPESGEEALSSWPSPGSAGKSLSSSLWWLCESGLLCGVAKPILASLACCCSRLCFLHLILRFWNQTFTLGRGKTWLSNLVSPWTVGSRSAKLPWLRQCHDTPQTLRCPQPQTSPGWPGQRSPATLGPYQDGKLSPATQELSLH